MTHLALNGNTVLLTMLLIALTIILSIVGLRYYWKNKLRTPVSRSENSPLKNTGGLHAFGICVALLTMITLMSWTQAERAVVNYNPGPFIEDEIINIPPTIHFVKKPKPIPPPPKPNPIIIEVEDLVEIEKPKEIPIEVPVDVVVKTSDVPSYAPQPKPVAPKEKLPEEKSTDIIEIVSIAERMPRFPGCFDEELSDTEQKQCTESELMKYVYDNLKYPKIARENGIEGRVILQFVIDTNGDIVDIKVVRDIGAGCGAAASKVIENMVEKEGFWTPGKQSHRKVKVRYTLPVTFQLQK